MWVQSCGIKKSHNYSFLRVWETETQSPLDGHEHHVLAMDSGQTLAFEVCASLCHICSYIYVVFFTCFDK